MQGRNPTKKQAMLIASKHLVYQNWLVLKDTPEEMHIRHRLSDTVRIIQKGRGGK